MTKEIVVYRDADAAIAELVADAADKQSLMSLWLGDKSKETARAYVKDLRDFAEFLRVPPAKALEAFLNLSAGKANAVVMAYRNDMRSRMPPLSPATVNRRLSAVRSIVKLGRRVGRINWSLDVDNLKGQTYRDTAGPGVDVLKTLLKTTEGTTKHARDRALLMVLFLMALRRGEVSELRYPDHVDMDRSRISILGKGRIEREQLTMAPEVKRAMKAWLEERGEEPGSLFGIATGSGIYDWLQRLKKKAGVTSNVRPHGIRHTAVTEYLERSKGNIRGAQVFARHKDPRVTTRYDDNRKDVFGEGSSLIAEGFLDDE